MKICPNCGYQNPDEAIYCMKCGAKLDNTPLKQISALENTRLWVMIAYIFSIVMTFVFLILLIFQMVNLALHISNL
ncbi:MAG: zinc-ribbon domain-containing protein, partial [Thermoplasmata archaeon]|nr:zinc-ribbon domain-containing protein [Euryarchaeota archaeon]